MNKTNGNLETLETTIVSDTHHRLAMDYAPRIRFDTKEPFLPPVIGYTGSDRGRLGHRPYYRVCHLPG